MSVSFARRLSSPSPCCTLAKNPQRKTQVSWNPFSRTGSRIYNNSQKTRRKRMPHKQLPTPDPRRMNRLTSWQGLPLRQAAPRRRMFPIGWQAIRPAAKPKSSDSPAATETSSGSDFFAQFNQKEAKPEPVSEPPQERSSLLDGRHARGSHHSLREG